MPILLNIDELEPGMFVARNIFNGYSLLLSHGHELNENDIKLLRRKFPDMSVPVMDPILDSKIEFEDDSQDQKVSKTVRKNVSAVVKRVSESVKTSVALDSDNVKESLIRAVRSAAQRSRELGG